MTDLLVDRLHVRATVAGPDDAARVRGLLADLERRRLDEALAGLRLPAGDWCVRRLDVPLRLDARCGDLALGRRWAQAITTALATATATDNPDIVHYPRAADAAADVVTGLALGDRSRLWAWRAAGALTAADPDPAAAPDQAALAVLSRDPAGGVHVLSAAVRRAGLPAVHRLLGVAGWQRAAELVLTAAGQAPGRWLAGDPAGTGPARTPGRRTGEPTPASARPVPTDAGAGTVAGIVARSPLAQAWRVTRLRPGPACVRAWAVLAAAEAEPALFRRPSAASALGLLRSAVTGEAAPAVPRDGATPDRRADSTAGALPTAGAPPAADTATAAGTAETAGTVPIAGSATAAGTASIEDVATTADAGPAPEPAPGALSVPGPAGPATTGNRRPQPHDPRAHDQRPHDQRPVDAAPVAAAPEPAEPAGQPTAWGGLVYLLATAPAAGLPDAALADPALAGRPAPWVLLQLTRRLCDAGTTGADDQTAEQTADRAAHPEPDPADDPAVRVLAGLPPSGPVPEAAPTSVERDRIDGYARRWAAATAARLGTDEDPAAVVTRLAARAGTIDAVPGWVEFRLSLDDVDLAVRRAGLDVDPGFVPWLGAVVVIRYG